MPPPGMAHWIEPRRSWPRTLNSPAANIHAAAILGDDPAVRRFLERDPANATVKSDPYGGDALVFLRLSKYLRLDQARSEVSCGRP